MGEEKAQHSSFKRRVAINHCPRGDNHGGPPKRQALILEAGTARGFLKSKDSGRAEESYAAGEGADVTNAASAHACAERAQAAIEPSHYAETTQPATARRTRSNRTAWHIRNRRRAV